MLTLGVITDTHIPERLRRLPDLSHVFRSVDMILHAGDISRPRVLADLECIAPVVAVSGNRDWFRGKPPLDRRFELEGVRVVLTHGHGGWRAYLKEKLRILLTGYRLERIHRRVRAGYDGVDVIVFGHTHRMVNRPIGGVLMFNPGSFAPSYYKPNFGPAVGKLYLDTGRAWGEIIRL